MTKEPDKQNGQLVEKLGGDELTTRTLTHWPVAMFTQEMFHERFGSGRFWTALENQLAECDAIMKENGWERSAEAPGRFPGDSDAHPYSDLWYAGLIGMMCWMVLTSRGPNDVLAEVNLSRVMGIGMRVTEWEWRQRYKPQIVTGRKTRKNMNMLREAENNRKKRLVDARRRTIAELLPKTRLTNGRALEVYIQKNLPTEDGASVSLRTIRRDLQALRS